MDTEPRQTDFLEAVEDAQPTTLESLETAVVDLQADSETEDRLLTGLGTPIRTGWALWLRSLRTLILHILPVAVLMALVTASMFPPLDEVSNETSAINEAPVEETVVSTDQDAQGNGAATEEAPVDEVDPFEELPPWPLLLILAALAVYGFALTGVILSLGHAGREVEQPFLWTAKRLLPWMGASALVFGVPIGVFFVAGIVMGLLGAVGPIGSIIGFVGFIAAMILMVVFSLRLFWADEFALLHASNPIEAAQESWQLTRKGARQIFSFQFVAGLVAYPVILISGGLWFVITFALALLAVFGLVWVPFFLMSTVGFLLLFLGYGILHAPELVYFYGIRAARQILDPEELATPDWIETAKREAINPS